MRYSLYSGAGNTFVLLENPLKCEEVVTLCQALKVDGVIFPRFSLPWHDLGTTDFNMRIFNSDGSEAEMCGNGLRCFIQFLRDQGFRSAHFNVDTLAGKHSASLDDGKICLHFPAPKDIRWDLSFDVYTIHHLNTGVPHAIIFMDDIVNIEIKKIGPLIRFASIFPKGVNVNLVDPKKLQIRTYERGVENETLACGTGTVAAALALSKKFEIPSPLSLCVRSGETLTVAFTPDWGKITLQGPAQRIQEGSFAFNQGTLIL